MKKKEKYFFNILKHFIVLQKLHVFFLYGFVHVVFSFDTDKLKSFHIFQNLHNTFAVKVQAVAHIFLYDYLVSPLANFIQQYVWCEESSKSQ